MPDVILYEAKLTVTLCFTFDSTRQIQLSTSSEYQYKPGRSVVNVAASPEADPPCHREAEFNSVCEVRRLKSQMAVGKDFGLTGNGVPGHVNNHDDSW